MKIGSINSAKDPAGKGKVEHEKMAADRKNARHFPQSRSPVRHVAQTKTDRDDIEALIRKRELKCIGDHGLFHSFATGNREHLGGKIGANNFGSWKFSCDR